MKTIFASLFLSFVFSVKLFGSAVLVSVDTLTEKCDIFEITVSDTNVYNNPFRDAIITALFNGLDDVNNSVKGIYYDSSYWKVRHNVKLPADTEKRYE